MSVSVIIARIIGPIYLILAAGMLLNREYYAKVLGEFEKNSALVLYGGMLALAFGLLILSFHNYWTTDWTVLITLFGWGGLVKGTWLIVFPGSVKGVTEAYRKNPGMIGLHGAVALIVGAVMTRFGYFVC